MARREKPIAAAFPGVGMKLIIEDDDGRKTVVPFVRDEISIGRKDGNTIRLTERNVSRRHARLSRGNGHVFIEDLGSYNGVKVNGGKVAGRAEIKEGDLIEIGDYNLAVQLEAADIPAGPDPATVPGAPALDAQSAPTAPQQRPMEPPPHVTQPMQAADLPRPAPRASTPVPAPAPSGAAPQPAAAPAPSSPQPAPPVSAPSRAESTAVIRIDLEALNRSDERRPLPPKERPRLVALSSSFAGQSFDLDHTSNSIGRTVDNDITLDHRSLSRHHCRIYLDGDGGWKVMDRGSANGVRVNGEEYGLIDLRRGDVVELGHIKLRFCEPGDNFVYTEEAREAVAAGAVGAVRQPAAGAKRSLAPVLAIVGAGSVAAIVLAVVFIGGPSGEGEDQAASTDQATADSTADPLREAIQAAGDAAENERWAEAIQAYRRALALDPSASAATQGLATVESEARAQQIFDATVQSAGSADWAAAWEGMAAIPEGSIFSERIEEHRERITEGYLSQLVGRASDHLRDSSWDEAIREADAVLALAPDHARATDIKSRAQRGFEREERQRQATEAQAERRAKLVAQRGQRTRQGGRQPQKAAAATKESGSDNGQEAQDAFNAGRAHVQRHEFREAVVQLERALRLDPRGQSIAHALLGTSYAHLGDNQRAHMHYRRFLDTNPNHPQAPQVRQIVEEFERSRSE